MVSGVKINSKDGPLGVRLIVNVVPNPILKKVEIQTINSVITDEYVDEVLIIIMEQPKPK